MSLRTRLIVLTSGAVALTIVAAAIIAWSLIRAAMLDEIDERLLGRATNADRIVGLTAALPEQGDLERRFVRLVQDDLIGLRLIGPDGNVTRQVAVDELTGALDDASWDPPEPEPWEHLLSTVTLADEPYRLLSAGMPDGSIMQLFQPLETIDATLARVTWSLGTAAAVGVALAAVLGWLISRSALRPVGRLVAATEAVSQTKDLGQRIRIPPGRRDEIGRLAHSVNEMLAALEHARQEQRTLVENASHELRTPLAVLRNDLGLLARSEDHDAPPFPRSERRQVLRDLDAQVSGLGDLVAELVDLARGTTEPEAVTDAELLPLVERAVERTRRINPSVKVRISGDPVRATVRPGTLERAIANLTRNAIQASPAGAEVHVDIRRTQAGVRIRVRDRGHGLEPDELPRVFERFFRGAAARHRMGSGLGLAIVAQAAELHGGVATVERRPGGGAQFSLEIPAGG